MFRPVNKKHPVTSPFGVRTHPVSGKQSFHKGVDFGCPVGSPCVASFDGVVEVVRLKADGNAAGNRVWLYDKTNRAGYFHLDDDGFNVKQGQAVKAGELLAFTGDTGVVTGPHLHFQLEDLKTMIAIEPVFDEEKSVG